MQHKLDSLINPTAEDLKNGCAFQDVFFSDDEDKHTRVRVFYCKDALKEWIIGDAGSDYNSEEPIHLFDELISFHTPYLILDINDSQSRIREYLEALRNPNICGLTKIVNPDDDSSYNSLLLERFTISLFELLFSKITALYLSNTPDFAFECYERLASMYPIYLERLLLGEPCPFDVDLSSVYLDFKGAWLDAFVSADLAEEERTKIIENSFRYPHPLCSRLVLKMQPYLSQEAWSGLLVFAKNLLEETKDQTYWGLIAGIARNIKDEDLYKLAADKYRNSIVIF